MSIATDLQGLKTNIENVRSKLYTNLTDKGITTISTASTLDVMADSVTAITGGGEGDSDEYKPSLVTDASWEIQPAELIDMERNSYNYIFDENKPYLYSKYKYCVDSTYNRYNYDEYGNIRQSYTTNGQEYNTHILPLDEFINYKTKTDSSNIPKFPSMFSEMEELDISGNTSYLYYDKDNSYYFVDEYDNSIGFENPLTYNSYYTIYRVLEPTDKYSRSESYEYFLANSGFTGLNLKINSFNNKDSFISAEGDTLTITKINPFISDGYVNVFCDGKYYDNIIYKPIRNYLSYPFQCKNHTKWVFAKNDEEITHYNFNGSKYVKYIDISELDLNLTSCDWMFSECNNLKTVIFGNGFNTSSATDMSYMFGDCYSLTSLDVTSFNTSNVTNISSMFSQCSGLTSLDVSSFDTSNVTDMRHMFGGCNSLTSITFGDNFDTSNVTDMSFMFSQCSGLTSLDVTSFNTSNVTNISSMFSQCSGLTSLDVSSFDTSNVTDMSFMFYSCSNLTSLNLSSFNTSNVTIMNSMFSQCSSLTSLDVTSFNTSNVTNMNSMFSNCTKLQRVDGYISIKSLSASTMSNYYLFGYSDISTLRKITFKDVGYHSNATQFNLSRVTNWGVDNDTITDGRQSLIDSLITYSFDRASAGYKAFTISLAANTKAVLTEDEIAQISAKGFTIA